jgi:signal transduction histidine kinase
MGEVMGEPRNHPATGGPQGRRGRGRWDEQFRQALTQIEEQRDDAVAYLSAIKTVLDVVARGQGARQCAQEIAEALVQQLALEACAVALGEGRGPLTLAGFASQSQRLGGPGDGLEETSWISLAQLVARGAEPTCFRRTPDGGFAATPVADLSGEGFLVLPFDVGGEPGGALVFYSLAGPAQVFARGRALALVAEIVGQTLTVARTREAVQRLCGDLESELGVTRQALSAREDSLRSYQENIQSLAQDLIRSNRVKREFLGTVSHELRTPLNAILGYAGLVREGTAGPLAGDQAVLLDRVLTNTRNLNALIDDMLFFVQLETDRVLFQPEEIATAELIEEVLASIPEPGDRHHVAVQVEVAPDAATLYVDAATLRRLLFHLLSNALKFTPRGEVRVSVRPGEERGAAILSVRDTGIGIAPERLNDVFQLFAQGDSSTTRRYSGLGMGLALVQRCVRLLGGDVQVESRPNVGSEFRVHLPGALAAPGEREPAPAARTSTIH